MRRHPGGGGLRENPSVLAGRAASTPLDETLPRMLTASPKDCCSAGGESDATHPSGVNGRDVVVANACRLGAYSRAAAGSAAGSAKASCRIFRSLAAVYGLSRKLFTPRPSS